MVKLQNKEKMTADVFKNNCCGQPTGTMIDEFDLNLPVTVDLHITSKVLLM